MNNVETLRSISWGQCFRCHSSGNHLKTSGMTLTMHEAAQIYCFVFLFRFVLRTIPHHCYSVFFLFFQCTSIFFTNISSPSHDLLDHIHLHFHCVLTAECISADQHNNRDVSTPLRQRAKPVEPHFVLKHQHGVGGRLRISVTFNLISLFLHLYFSPHTQ